MWFLNLFAAVAISVGSDLFADWVAGLCHCGKHRFPVLSRVHAKTPGLWLAALIMTFAQLATFAAHLDLAGFLPLVTLFAWIALWIHEKDKIKRAAKALSKVVTTSAGRLRVVPTMSFQKHAS